MSDRRDAFAKRYRDALRRWLDTRDERELAAAYELGRGALRDGITLLDLAAVHHDSLPAAFAAEGAESGAAAAGSFFCEALSAFEVVQRVLEDAREAAVIERRQTAILRQLSTFLADAAIAADAGDGFEEMLQLVAEHARELTGARECVARLDGREVRDGERTGNGSAGVLAAPLTALDGRTLGRLEVADKEGGAFTVLDEAVVTQLAQMTAAAVERAQLYSA